VALAASITACGGKKTTSTPIRAAPAAPAAVRKSTRPRRGNIEASSRSKARRRRTTDQDERGSGVREGEPTPQTQETYEVADGKLANVFRLRHL